MLILRTNQLETLYFIFYWFLFFYISNNYLNLGRWNILKQGPNTEITVNIDKITSNTILALFFFLKILKKVETEKIFKKIFFFAFYHNHIQALKLQNEKLELIQIFQNNQV